MLVIINTLLCGGWSFAAAYYAVDGAPPFLVASSVGAAVICGLAVVASK